MSGHKANSAGIPDMEASTSTERAPIGAPPLLSVVIPIWNRQDTLKRCLDSILAQSLTEYEIIAVDDGSEDGSIDVLKSYSGEQRLRILQHERNIGSYAARRTGFDSALGEWFLVLGSDDELVPGALARFAEMTEESGPEVGLLGMSYRYDDGTLGPQPPFPEGEIDFEGWLRWSDGAKRTDFLSCFRRQVFDCVEMPVDGRGGHQVTLRVVSRWKTRVDRRVGGIVHSDASNQLSKNKFSYIKQSACLANAKMSEEVMTEFGMMIQKHAPTRYLNLFLQAGIWYMLARHKQKGIRYLIQYLRIHPLKLKVWIYLVLGLFGMNTLCKILKK